MDRKKFYNLLCFSHDGKGISWFIHAILCWKLGLGVISSLLSSISSGHWYRIISDQRSKCQYLLKCFDKTPNQKNPSMFGKLNMLLKLLKWNGIVKSNAVFDSSVLLFFRKKTKNCIFTQMLLYTLAHFWFCVFVIFCPIWAYFEYLRKILSFL